MKSLIVALLASSALAAPCAAQVTTLYSFSGATDGENPHGGVIYQGGSLYGTTGFGGTSQYGTVFKIDVATGAETVLHRFGGGADGANPFGGLLYFGGALYGTSWGGGGSCDCGTVFRMDPVNGANTVLHIFGGADGGFPVAALIYHAGSLYGTTSQGGRATRVAFSASIRRAARCGRCTVSADTAADILSAAWFMPPAGCTARRPRAARRAMGWCSGCGRIAGRKRCCIVLLPRGTEGVRRPA